MLPPKDDMPVLGKGKLKTIPRLSMRSYRTTSSFDKTPVY
jgi:hypothetical protein